MYISFICTCIYGQLPNLIRRYRQNVELFLNVFIHRYKIKLSFKKV